MMKRNGRAGGGTVAHDEVLRVVCQAPALRVVAERLEHLRASHGPQMRATAEGVS